MLGGIGLDAWRVTEFGVENAIPGSQMAFLILGLNILMRSVVSIVNPVPAGSANCRAELLCIIILDGRWSCSV